MRVEQIGDCTLYLGDCLDVLPTLLSNSIDVVVTDPPYSLGYSFQNDNLTHSEQVIFMKKYITEIFKVIKTNGTAVIFMEQKLSHHLYFVALECGFTWQNTIIWNRDGGQMPTTKFGICYEPISVFTKGNSHAVFNLDLLRVKSKYSKSDKRLNPLGKNPGDVWYVPALFGKKIERIKGDNNKAAHPTQKPIDIIYPFIEAYTNICDTVLDCFMGTGTTGECALKMNRKFIGIEIDKKYFDIACKRIEKEMQQVRLFPVE